ncbi:MAG: hypothetical protein CL775_03255 [Chloroflexi bacterium]|nr:hypothetical protein [Chloroflexota bacterium]
MKERHKIRIIESNVNIIINFGKILIQKKTLLCISLFVILTLGCNSKSNVTYSSDEIINISKIFVNQSKTFEFTLTHRDGYTLLPGNLNISKAKGKIQKPNKILIDAEIISNDFLLKLSYLTFDEKFWITNPISNKWGEIPNSDNPFKEVNPIQIIVDIITKIKSSEIKSYNDNSYNISATIISNDLKSLVGDMIIPDKSVKIELSILPNGEILKVNIIGEVQPKDTLDTIRIIKFYNWDKPIEWKEPLIK